MAMRTDRGNGIGGLVDAWYWLNLEQRKPYSMKRTTRDEMKRMTHDEMIEWAVSHVLSAFGQGENLRGCMATVVNRCAHWGAENTKQYMEAREKEEKATMERLKGMMVDD